MRPNVGRVFVELSALTAAVMLLSWAPLFFEILVDRACGSDELPAAWLLQLKHSYDVFPWPVLLGLGVFGVLAWSRARPRLAGAPRYIKLLVIGGALISQALVFVFLVFVTITFDPNWLFGHGRPDVSQPSPDGKRTAYGFHSCFFGCKWTAYVQEGHALTMQKSESQEAREEQGATLEWSADSKVVKLALSNSLTSGR